MGLLDSVLGGAAGGGGGTDPKAITGALQALLSEGGGVEGLQQRFQKGGMQDMFASWVSTGPNPPVKPDQVQGALGADLLGKLAAKLGMDAGQLTALLAKFLPDVIDKLTPNGKIEANQNVEQGLQGILPGLLQGGLSKLLGSG